MDQKQYRKMIVILSILCAAVFVFSLAVGRYMIGPAEFSEVFKNLFDGSSTEPASVVFRTTRLPRVIIALLIGMALSAAGCAYQGIFRNPMVSPDLLGASNGAGFGAALGFLFGLPSPGVQILAFVCGLGAVALTWSLKKAVSGDYDNRSMVLVLCGIIVSAFFQALISIVKYIADPYNTLINIAFMLMGGLNYVTSSDLLFLAVPVVIGLIPLILYRWRINLLAFGEEEAAAMGINTAKLRAIVIICATLVTSSAVAVGGMIGWVGLIVPHFARMAVGSDLKKLLPCTILMGGSFLMLVDDAARCILAQEIPIGILTALIGAPLFIYLLLKGKRSFL